MVHLACRTLLWDRKTRYRTVSNKNQQMAINVGVGLAGAPTRIKIHGAKQNGLIRKRIRIMIRLCHQSSQVEIIEYSSAFSTSDKNETIKFTLR